MSLMFISFLSFCKLKNKSSFVDILSRTLTVPLKSRTLDNRAESARKVFGQNSSQEKIYSQAISPIVEEVLEGFNCTIFAYGEPTLNLRTRSTCHTGFEPAALLHTKDIGV